MSHTTDYIHDAIQILTQLDGMTLDRMIGMLVKLRERAGRVFVLGVGGSAANAGHMVNDLRRMAQIEAYAPTDNVAELTARANEDGWESVFVPWLATSRLSDRDMVFVLSVGGGDIERNVSSNLVHALQYAQEVGATICGIVGRNGGYTARVADACVIVPTVNTTTVTPHTQAFQAILWHLMVSHPALHAVERKWESSSRRRAA